MDESTCQSCGGGVSVASPHGLCSACLTLKGLQSNTLAREARRRNDWQPPPVEEIAARFPELDQIALIGRGGMGAVFSARQKHLDRTVALKILPPQLLEDPAFAERFAREAQALARLNHPHIVTIHDFGRHDDLFYLIMEYVDGPTLRQVVSTQRLGVDEAMAIIRQVCDALQFAHEQGIVHRDIKPENILINQRGHAKIADFGLAKLVEAEPQQVPIDATSSIVGTPLYMAPEQIQSPGTVDQRADIYSIGVVLHEMLTGELPDADMAASLSHGNVALNELVARALQPDRAARFASIREFRTLLETIPSLQGTITIPSAPRPPVQASEQRSSRRSAIEKQVLKQVRASIAVPARGIKYAAIANIVFLLLTTIPALLSFISTAPEKVIDNPLGLHLSLPWWATGAFVFTMLSMVLNVMVVAGAGRMRELRSYGWSLASAILCLFAAPANVVGAVFGVWAIFVLARARTRQAFGVSRVQLDALAPPSQHGLVAWLPLAHMHKQRKAPNLVNYVLVAATLWLVSYVLISLVLLGKPASWICACLLVLPALAVPQSMLRLHRRLTPAVLQAAHEDARRPIPLALRFIVFAAALLLYAAANHALAIRALAEQRAAATRPAKPSVAERLHLTVPKVK